MLLHTVWVAPTCGICARQLAVAVDDPEARHESQSIEHRHYRTHIEHMVGEASDWLACGWWLEGVPCSCGPHRCAASAACTWAAPAAGLPSIYKCSCTGSRTVEVARHGENSVTSKLFESPAQILAGGQDLPVSWCRHGYLMDLYTRSQGARSCVQHKQNKRVTESA